MLFRYPGGKAKLSAQIIALLNNCLDSSDLEYREPFFGAGSIGLSLLAASGQARLPDEYIIKSAWINDRDIGIASLWTAVVKYPLQLCERITGFIPSTKAFTEYTTELLSISQVPRNPMLGRTSHDKAIVDIGFKKLAVHQISYSGLGTMAGGPLGGASQKSQYKVDSRWSPEHLCKQVHILNRQLGYVKLRDGSCTSVDFEEMIDDDSSASLLYLDPPYFDQGNKLYQHGFTIGDHERLAAAFEANSAYLDTFIR